MDKTITEKPNSYKVAVKTSTDKEWVSNGLRFKTKEQALTYAKDLFARWTAVKEYEVQPSEDAITEREPSQKGFEDSGILVGPE